MSAIRVLWDLNDHVELIQHELVRVQVDMRRLGRELQKHHHVLCAGCGRVVGAPIPGDAICDCGHPLEVGDGSIPRDSTGD